MPFIVYTRNNRCENVLPVSDPSYAVVLFMGIANELGVELQDDDFHLGERVTFETECDVHITKDDLTVSYIREPMKCNSCI